MQICCVRHEMLIFLIDALTFIQLAAMYLHGSPLNQPAWAIVGLGLRTAQELGAHRRRRYSSTPTVEGELMKRAFW